MAVPLHESVYPLSCHLNARKALARPLWPIFQRLEQRFRERIAIRDARPMGLQLIGHPKGDGALLEVAAAYETMVKDLLKRRPPMPDL